MRISVWQQFSSNHSASYVIVGQFESTDKARTAGEIIKQIVSEIAQWSDEQKAETGQFHWHLAPIEEKYAREYKIDWKEPIDWLHPFPRNIRVPYQRLPEEHVMIFDRVVMVEALGSWTHQTGHQFVDLIRAMGGKPYEDVYMGEHPDFGTDVYKNLALSLTCRAPTAQAAAEIYEQINSHLENNRESLMLWQLIPWIFYHPRYVHLTGSMPRNKFIEVEKQWIQEHRAWADFLDSHEGNYAEHKHLWSSFIKQNEMLDGVIGSLRFYCMITSGMCRRNNEHEIELVDVDVGSHISGVVVALCRWLQDLNCVVEYQFRQVEV